MLKVTRRQMIKMLGLGAAGAVLAACKPPAPPTPSFVIPEEVQVPTGNRLEGFTPKKTNPTEMLNILYWWGNAYEPAMDFTHKVIARFALAYPNVKVDTVDAQACDAFTTASAAGTPPDVFHHWGCNEVVGSMVNRKMVLPLDEYISATGFDLKDFWPGTYDDNYMDGKMWAFLDTGGVFLWWNRPGQFADIGKKPTDMPQDTDEMWEWARKLTTKDQDGNIQRLGMLFPSWIWPRLGWLAHFGGQVWDTAKNEPSPDHPGVIEALSDLVAQVKYFGVDALDRWNTSIGSQGGEQSPYLAGTMNMQFDGDWSGQSIFDFHPEWKFGTDYSCAPLPLPPKNKLHGESTVPFWSWSWVIPTGAKNPEWSWEFLRFLQSAEYQLNVHPKFKEMVVRKSMMEDKRLWWPAVYVAKEIVREGKRKMAIPIPMTPIGAEYFTLINEAWDNIMHLKETPEAAMARVKTEALAKLKEATSS